MKAGRGGKGRGFFDGINKRGGLLEADWTFPLPINLLNSIKKSGSTLLQGLLFSC
jgi:hypothetical protein